MDFTQLIGALSAPTAFPFAVESVAVHQTHISVVFLAGPYAYKIKKPVKLAFLDFSTLEARHHFCEEEVRLNRRLAPQVYLAVVPIGQSGTHIRFEGEGEVIEWAVKMTRLPDEATFLEYLLRGEINVEQVESLARRIAAFHREAETTEQIAAFGRFETVSRNILDIFTQAVPEIETTVSTEVFSRLRDLSEQSLAQLNPLVETRANRGMTRDCHGDLHLDHVYLFPERKPPDDLVIIDCIEFNERFRFIDPVADMAFPSMDLAFHGRQDLARAFADAYFLASGDEEGRPLLPLYSAYRATVRGMVEGLELEEKEVSEGERAAALVRAKAHWLLALTELEVPERKPCLLLVSGLPGTGKSKLSQLLANRANFTVIRSDLIRKQLAGLAGTEPTPPQIREMLYNQEWNDRTYAECLKETGRLLFQGHRVIVDATFREVAKRQAFLKAAIQWGVPAYILLCQANPETVRKRLANRKHDASDADWSIHVQLAANWEESKAKGGSEFHAISMEESAEQGLSQALDVLRLLGLWK